MVVLCDLHANRKDFVSSSVKVLIVRPCPGGMVGSFTASGHFRSMNKQGLGLKNVSSRLSGGIASICFLTSSGNAFTALWKKNSQGGCIFGHGCMVGTLPETISLRRIRNFLNVAIVDIPSIIVWLKTKTNAHILSETLSVAVCRTFGR